MEQQIKTILALWALYIFMFIFTYGHAAHHETCRFPDIKYDPCASQIGEDAIFDGMFWPLYWSKELQK